MSITEPKPTDLLRSAREDVGEAYRCLWRARNKFKDAGLTDVASDVERTAEDLELFAEGLPEVEGKEDAQPGVNCFTCHRGKPHPGE